MIDYLTLVTLSLAVGWVTAQLGPDFGSASLAPVNVAGNETSGNSSAYSPQTLHDPDFDVAFLQAIADKITGGHAVKVVMEIIRRITFEQEEECGGPRKDHPTDSTTGPSLFSGS
ncbi:hypothetical protein BV898_10064 [Hypsibius exemplaris]|uniref:Uncharacterized protein n=1 Tax=Hypsibius exemplaris TaxID=2072580 RepID=A0A1W0WKW0_HYPEX|nr:hypothetical protein BV898_10064 [Hypsibius exemplaris]